MPAKAKPFDFEKFIKSAQDKPRIRRVKILAADNSDEVSRLQEELAGALADEQINGGDRRLGEKTKSATLYARIKKLQAETADSGQEFTFRSLNFSEYSELISDGLRAGEENYETRAPMLKQLRMQCLSPDLTDEQWAQLADTLPAGEFGKLTKCAESLAEDGVETPKVSPTILEAMQQQESDKN